MTENIGRDRDADERLAAAGWLVLVVWEHEDVDEAAARVANAVRTRRAASDRT